MKKLVVLTGIALAAAVVNEKLKDATRPHISHIQISSEENKPKSSQYADL